MKTDMNSRELSARVMFIMTKMMCSEEAKTHVCTLLGLAQESEKIFRGDAEEAIEYFGGKFSHDAM